MQRIVFRQLIDAAIGSPGPGHVDFQSLQCVLYHFADKLAMLDSPVDSSKFRHMLTHRKKGFKRSNKSITSSASRLIAGADDEAEAQVSVPEVAQIETPANDVEGDPITPEAVETVAEEMPASTGPEVEEVVPPTVEETPEQPVTEPVEEEARKSIVIGSNFEVVDGPVAAEPEIVGKRESERATVTSKKEVVEDSNIESGREKRVDSIKSSDGKIQYIYEPISEDLLAGIKIMKEQIELAMEQINMLTNLEVRGKRKSLIESLKGLNKKMRHIQRSNFYIEGRDKSENESLEENQEEVAEEAEDQEEEEVVYRKVSQPVDIQPEATNFVQPTLEYHLCYSPEKIMDELLDLKAEFCNLTNKVNDVMVAIDDMDSQRTKVIIFEMQDQMREVRYIITVLKEGQEYLHTKIKINTDIMNDLEKNMSLLQSQKVGRAEMELALAEKVDFELLERKVSHDQLKEMVCRIEKQFCEMQRLINFNEKHALQIIENMRKNLGLDNVDEMLKNFREKVDEDIKKLQTILQNYLDSTNDDCAAAGARVQVLKDLACISCDTNCVMRKMEKAKVGKLRNAHVTPALGPLITYELGNIRKSGIMGYYRKDEFPYAPNAWLNRKNVSLNMCLPRHAGGEHTTNTAKEIIDKVVKRVK